VGEKTVKAIIAARGDLLSWLLRFYDTGKMPAAMSALPKPGRAK
jgi:hypothetical protein